MAAGNGGIAFGSAAGGPNGGFGFGAGLGGNGRMMVVNGGFNGRNMGGRKMGEFIVVTHSCNSDPLKHHFEMLKWGLEVYTLFSI